MHSLLRHFHGGDSHSAAAPAPATTGRLIRWAKYYDLTVQIMALGQAGKLRRLTVAQAQIKPGEAILDVGCGTGDLTLLAKKTSGPTGQVAGLDAAPEMIEVARGKARRTRSEVDFRVGVIEQLPFSDGSFDVVFSSLMMHHLPDDLKRRGLREIRRVLRDPGGRLVIVDFKGLLEAQQVVLLLQEAGFTQVEVQSKGFKTLGIIRAA